MKNLILQAKGGVGKTHFAMLMMLYYESKNQRMCVWDVDNDTPALKGVCDNKKAGLIEFGKINLLNNQMDLDKGKFDKLLERLSVEERPVIADFGAGSSGQFLHYLTMQPDLIPFLKEINVKLFFVMAGGFHYNLSLDFMRKLKELDGVENISVLVANEVFGGINNGTLSEAIQADISIEPNYYGSFTNDTAVEWQKYLKDGLEYSNLDVIAGTPMRIRTKAYLKKLFEKIDHVFENVKAE